MISINIDGTTDTSFNYSIPGRSAKRLKTSDPSSSLKAGSVVVIPNSGNSAPTVLVIFSLNSSGVTVTEAASHGPVAHPVTHENREPATTRWVRAAGADKMRAAAQRAHLGLDFSPIFGTGVLSVRAATAFRMYAEASGNFGDPGLLQSGFAVRFFSSSGQPLELDFP